MKKYFAYGSNLSFEQMGERCPEHKKIGKGMLEGYKWFISSRGYANVIESPGDVVHGFVYEISEEDERVLDLREGVHLGLYRREILPVALAEGGSVDCLVYIDSAPPAASEDTLTARYRKVINRGIKNAKLPPEYVRGVIRKFVPAERSVERELPSSTIEGLNALDSYLSQSRLPLAREWGGAGLIVKRKMPDKPGGDWRSVRYVVTPHAMKVSWFIERTWDAFMAEDRFDSCSKYEFFGRLGNAVERCMDGVQNAGAHLQCAAVLREAYAIYDEMGQGKFTFLPITVNGRIVDDLAEKAFSVNEIVSFFEKRGVDTSAWRRK